MNTLIEAVRRVVRSCGYDVVHFTPLKPLLEKHQIDLVLDVGANLGQTYDLFRESGYQGKIVSFEPNAAALAFLNKKSGYNWEKHQVALSTKAGEAEFFAMADLGCSGLHRHLKDPIVSQFMVPTQRLDQMWNWEQKSAFLKVDTEGHDMEVIKGAAGIMDHIKLIMVEATFRPRYEGEPILCDVVTVLGNLGFQACKIQRLYTDPAQGVDTDMDLIFCRR